MSSNESLIIPVVQNIRFHGRGGQGVVTASRLLSEAAVLDGKYVHGFPAFGPERSGAPIAAFAKLSDKQFYEKTEIYDPDIIVCQDPTLLGPGILEGAKEDAIVIVTYPGDADSLKEKLVTDLPVYYLDAIKIGTEILGRPIANTVMLGALLRVRELVPLDKMFQAIKNVFKGEVAEKNIEAVKRAYDEVKKLE